MLANKVSLNMNDFVIKELPCPTGGTDKPFNRTSSSIDLSNRPRTQRQYPLPCWRIKPINRRGWFVAENDWEVKKEVVIWRSGIIHPDCWLLPIRPTEDEQDVSVVEESTETSLV